MVGQLEPNKIYIHGLSEKISRDQLELTLEEITDCDVTDVVYGLNPTVAMVTFKKKIGMFLDASFFLITIKNLQKWKNRKVTEFCLKY